MPTYEYLCVDCGNRKEVVQSFTDEPLQVCEVCGGKLRKVIYPVGIQFKGSGFYSTDRRASQPMPRKTDGKVDVKGDGAKESKSESKSDSKSESKSDSKPDSSGSGSGDKAPASKAAEKSA